LGFVNKLRRNPYLVRGSLEQISHESVLQFREVRLFSSEKAVSLPAARHMPVGSLLYAKPEHSRALKVVARASQSPWFDFTRGRG
jgi:hypothetical protein